MYKGNGNAGRTIMDRGGATRSRGGATYGKSTTRTKSGGSYNPSYRSRSTWAPSRNGSSGNSAMRGYSGSYKSSPSYRSGGSSWGGSRSGYSGGSRGFSGGGSRGFSGGGGGGGGRGFGGGGGGMRRGGGVFRGGGKGR